MKQDEEMEASKKKTKKKVIQSSDGKESKSGKKN